MKTNKNTKNENTRLNSIIRVFVLVALTGVATLNVLKAGDPESKIIERPDYETNYLSNTGTKRIANSEDTFTISDFDVYKEYKGIPVNFKFNLLEYRLQLALEEEPEPEMEIEEWMLDIDEFIQQINFAKK